MPPSIQRVARLTTKSGELVCEPPHEVDKPDNKEERPSNLNEIQTEINGSTYERDEYVIDSIGRKTGTVENCCSACGWCRHFSYWLDRVNRDSSLKACRPIV